MNAELWAEIRWLHRIEKVTIAEIARRVSRDRKTVRRALRSDRVPVVTRVPSSSDVAPFASYLVDRLAAHPHLPGPVLLRELRQQGFPGGLRILQRHLRRLREKVKPVFLRIETPPGQQAQCDWAQCGSVVVGKSRRNLSAFVMVLGYSRFMYVEFTLSQCLEDFIQCHLNAFRAWGGVPLKILYDNLKQVVLSRFGADIRFNPAFMEFAGVYGFQPVPCNVARGNEKGKVENGIYFLRINFLAGQTPAWPDVNKEVQLWLDETANTRIHRTTRERPVDRLAHEKPFLLPLPARPYDAAVTRAVRSSHQSLVRFDGNFYSVPHKYAYKTLVLKATSTQVRLLLDCQEVAAHPRSYDRGQVIEDPKHYEGILATKRQYFHTILHKRFAELGPVAKTFLDGLIAADLHPIRHLQQILMLVTTYGKDEVLSAMEHAMTCNALGSAYVQNILLQRRAAKGLPELPSLEIPQRPEWNTIETPDPDLSLYDEDLGPTESSPS
ncbi:MAG TPA: IS21 family transposase [Elusimicrobiota bacterium]|nr:IS21 family transposase [Elusimicrobiota bacterium]